MSDERQASERDAVLRERAAFMEGVAWLSEHMTQTLTEAIAEAKERYPMPGIAPFALSSSPLAPTQEGA